MKYSTEEKLTCVLTDATGRHFTVNTEHIIKYNPRRTTEVVDPSAIIPRPVIDDPDPYPSRTAKVPEEKRETRIEEIHRLLERGDKRPRAVAPRLPGGFFFVWNDGKWHRCYRD